MMMLRLLFAALPLLSVSGLSATPSAQDGYFEIPERVADHVWVIRHAIPFHLQPIGNVTLVEQKDGLILIDSGGSAGSGRRIAAIIRRLSTKPIKTVLLTHWHPDHSLGLSAIVAAWPDAQIIATGQTRDDLLGAPMAKYAKGAPDAAHAKAFREAIGKAVDRMNAAAREPRLSPEERAGYERSAREFAIYREDGADSFVVTPTEILHGSMTLPDARAPVVLEDFGTGHTDGDAIAWLPKQHILVAGDLVSSPVPYGTDQPSSWIKSLDRLLTFPYRLLIPGHGLPEHGKQYPRNLVAFLRDMRMRALVEPTASPEQLMTEPLLSRETAALRPGDPWIARWFRDTMDSYVKSVRQEAAGPASRPQ